MDNKKSFAVFCIATLMALIIAIGAYIYMKTSVKTPLPPMVEETSVSLPDVEDTKQTTMEEVQPKSVEIQTAHPAKKSVKTSTSQAEQPQKEIPLIQVEKSVEQPAQLQSIYKDSSTNDIVITTEYKMTSPAKYSFK